MKLKQIALAAAVVAAAGSAAAQMADTGKMADTDKMDKMDKMAGAGHTAPLPTQRMGAEFASGVSVYGIVDVNVNNAKT